jgi:two-component system OmpR family sensor kinase
MATSLILFLFISVLFFFDQRTVVLKELEDEMIAFISLSRNGNNKIENKNFTIEAKPSEHYDYPVFYEDTDKDEFVSVTCASKYMPNKVFVVSADKSVITDKLEKIAMKIGTIMSFAFLFFLILAYYLAKLSIKPIKESRKIINNVLEEIVHDLNAPMTSIALNCESLEEKLSDSQDIKYIKRINQSNKTIKFLYNNLELLTDKPVQTSMEMTFLVENVLEDKIAFYKELYPETKFIIDLTSSKYHTDKIAFERIVDNLLSNAIKYSQPNPEIEVTLKNSVLIISDNGMGIKDCEKIFERNYREIQGTSCAYGFGLGLAIVKKLCDQMNINITLQSKEKSGSTFVLVLPRQE